MKLWKMSIIAFVLTIILAGGYCAIEAMDDNATQESIAFIREHFNNGGKLIDYNNEINVTELNDIKLFVDDKDVRIDFGSIRLEWSLSEFVEEENLKALETIFIEVRRDKDTGKLRVFYKGKEIRRWVS